MFHNPTRKPARYAVMIASERLSLLRAAESTARDCGKTLLVLDTASAEAERLYARAGWVRVGVIPGYALLPRGGLCDTTVFYRGLAD